MAKLTDKAHPTTLGWVHPRTGELLKSQKMTDAQIAEWWNSHHATSEPAPVAPLHHNPQTLHEAPSVERTLTESEVSHHYDDEV